MDVLVCNHCPDSVLELDVEFAERGFDFDRHVCPTCKTSFPDGSPIILAQRGAVLPIEAVLGAVVMNDGSGRSCSSWAACEHCGWAWPKGGTITESQAQWRADSHNAESHA